MTCRGTAFHSDGIETDECAVCPSCMDCSVVGTTMLNGGWAFFGQGQAYPCPGAGKFHPPDCPPLLLNDNTTMDSSTCATGYEGENCGTDTDECTPTPCLNGGECADSNTNKHDIEPGAFSCTCVGTFSGDTCESAMDHCSPPPCLNGGACTTTADAFTCDCPGGTEGDYCETDINELTGGRGGTASDAIGALIDMDKNSPATEKQVSTIISMTDKLEMPIEDAIAAVNTESIETITKSDASLLIGNLKKTINSKRRGKK